MARCRGARIWVSPSLTELLTSTPCATKSDTYNMNRIVTFTNTNSTVTCNKVSVISGRQLYPQYITDTPPVAKCKGARTKVSLLHSVLFTSTPRAISSETCNYNLQLYKAIQRVAHGGHFNKKLSNSLKLRARLIFHCNIMKQH